MKVLVTGVKGQLGYDVIKRLKAQNIECLGVDIDDFDLTDESAVIKNIEEYSPDVVVHCAAYTAVDKAEDEKDLCFKINVGGTMNVAKACRNISAAIVYPGTDYVFDGHGETPFETSDVPSPINHYARTKYEGELIIKDILEKYFIVRISWVFGINGNNFVKTMLRLGGERDTINVVNDQIGSPTYTYDLAFLIKDMIQTEKYGLYHATNEGFCSWYEFALEIFKKAGVTVNVNPILSNDYPSKAIRPLNSRLSKASLDTACFKRLPDWKDALDGFLLELGYELHIGE